MISGNGGSDELPFLFYYLLDLLATGQGTALAIVPISLGAEPNDYRMLLLIQLSPYGLYQITGQNQEEFADKRLSLE